MSTFYSLNVATDLPLLHGFFDSISTLIPDDVTISFDGTGDILNETNGELTGGWTEDAPASVQGVSGAPYPAPSGMCVLWETGVVMDGTRLRGKTYIVPAAGEVYDVAGSINAEKLATLAGAASSLAAACQLVVWHRPRAARAADGSRPAVEFRAGGYASISGATVHDIAVVLTSRRD